MLKSIRKFFTKLNSTIRHSFFLLWLLYISCCLTIIIYHWFYNWYLPKNEFHANVDFELNCMNKNQIDKNCELIGSVELVDYDNGVFMRMGEEYKFILEIFVPECDRNYNIGIFGVSAELRDDDHIIIDSFRTTVKSHLFF